MPTDTTDLTNSTGDSPLSGGPSILRYAGVGRGEASPDSPPGPARRCRWCRDRLVEARAGYDHCSRCGAIREVARMVYGEHVQNEVEQRVAAWIACGMPPSEMRQRAEELLRNRPVKRIVGWEEIKRERRRSRSDARGVKEPKP